MRIILAASWINQQTDWLLTYADKVWTHRGWEVLVK